MTTPDGLTAEAEALLLEGIRAAFATAEGNVQTPERIVAFLRVAYLPAIEAAAVARDREGLVEVVARRIFSDDRAWDDVPRPELEPYYSEARRLLALDAPEAQS